MDLAYLQVIRANIKRIRNEKGLSQRDVSRSSGISPSQYNRIEKTEGGSDPSLSSLSRVAKALEVELYELFLDPNQDNLPVIEKFKKFELLPEEEKEIIVRMMDITLERERMKKENFKN